MLKQATVKDIKNIMSIIEDAKTYLRKQNSRQWNGSDGYPSEKDLLKDIENESCFIYIQENVIIGTMSIIFTPDENYDEIDGEWLTNGNYASIHRIAVKNGYHNQQIGTKMLYEAEKVVTSKNVYSIKIDTHKINIPMIKTITNSGYTYCGIITLKRTKEDNLRNAYEKRLTK